MKVRVVTKGGEALVRKFKQHPNLLMRSTRSLLAQEGRELCYRYSAATVPGPGFDTAKMNQFRNRIDGDVRRVFATREEPNQIFAMMKIHAPELANAYWHAIKANKPRAADELRRKANLPTGLNPADHKKSRTAKKGRVAALPAPLSVAPAHAVTAYSRKMQNLAGFAKAGWYIAAKAIGGRMRANIRAEGGKRSTQERFPGDIRKLGNRFPNIGGARFSGTGSRMSLEIFTRVKHAREATDEGLFASATANAQEAFGKALGESLRALNRKLFGRKAA